MEITLNNKNAIVCGSTQGIGKATAVELALMGANVTLIARDKSKLASVVSNLDTNKDKVTLIYVLISVIQMNYAPNLNILIKATISL